jgi:putative membrane protein
MDAPDGQKQEPPAPSRTRDHLANERTLLAWVRTGVAIIGLGFIVARFGLLLALTICGVIVLLLSLQRYRVVGEGIERNEYGWAPRQAIALTVTLAAAGILLAIYLVITA